MRRIFRNFTKIVSAQIPYTTHFRCRLRIRGDICNRKSTPRYRRNSAYRWLGGSPTLRIDDTGSRRFCLSVIRGVADFAYRWYGSRRLTISYVRQILNGTFKCYSIAGIPLNSRKLPGTPFGHNIARDPLTWTLQDCYRVQNITVYEPANKARHFYITAAINFRQVCTLKVESLNLPHVQNDLFALQSISIKTVVIKVFLFKTSFSGNWFF